MPVELLLHGHLLSIGRIRLMEPQLQKSFFGW